METGITRHSVYRCVFYPYTDDYCNNAIQQNEECRSWVPHKGIFFGSTVGMEGSKLSAVLNE